VRYVSVDIEMSRRLRALVRSGYLLGVDTGREEEAEGSDEDEKKSGVEVADEGVLCDSSAALMRFPAQGDLRYWAR
jgi:hypothetical protein